MNALQSPHLPRLLTAHRHQGESNDCAPFTVSMVVGALLQRPVQGEALARRLNRPRWRGLLPVVRRIPNGATFPWGVVDALREEGLPARWYILATETLLRQTLARGGLPLPIFGAWWPRLWAHVAVLAAWDPVRGWGFVDPAHPRAEVVWRSADAFRRLWGAFGRLLVVVNAEEGHAGLVS